MKIIHLSDLHLGKRLKEFSLLEDQEYILGEITAIVRAETPRAVILAGDIYDKPAPSAEAVRLFDGFLYELHCLCPDIFVISGNHDSPDRIAFGGRLMEGSGVHIAPAYAGVSSPVELADEHGPARFYMLPFIRPSVVRHFYPESSAETYTDALRTAISHMAVDIAVRNILITHQFVTGAVRSDSEDIPVGGLDNVDAAVFSCFDYVALGHIHRPQSAGGETLRYCGTPLKYSFSEKDQEKSVTVAELGAKGDVRIRAVPLTPLRDMRQIRGTHEELLTRKNYENTCTEDYLRVILTDKRPVYDAMRLLRQVYPNIMELEYESLRARSAAGVGLPEAEKAGAALFDELFEKKTGRPMTDEQAAFAEALFRRIEEDCP